MEIKREVEPGYNGLVLIKDSERRVRFGYFNELYSDEIEISVCAEHGGDYINVPIDDLLVIRDWIDWVVENRYLVREGKRD